MKRGLPRRLLAVIPTLEGGRFIAVQRHTDGIECTRQAVVVLPDDMPAAEAGAAIRAALQAEAVHRAPAVLCVPPDWCTTRALTIPPGAQARPEDFLRLQAEAHLSPGGEALAIAHSAHAAAEEGPRTLLMALPARRLRLWEARLRAAGLPLQASCPAVFPVADSGAPAVEVRVLILGHNAHLQAFDRHALVCWQTIRLGAPQGGTEAAASVLFREIPIRLAEFPAALARSLPPVRILCDAADVGMVECLRRHAAAAPGGLVWQVETAAEPLAESLARGTVGCLVSAREMVFTDQRPSSDGQERRRRMLVAAVALLALALLGEGAFVLLQTRKLARLRATHRTLAPDLMRVTAMRDAVRDLRPWYDRQPLTLDILRDIANAFPKDGRVTLTHLAVSDNRSVTLTGEATAAQSWLEMQEALQACPRISNLSVTQTRDAAGAKGVSFSLAFDWNRTGASS